MKKFCWCVVGLSLAGCGGSAFTAEMSGVDDAGDEAAQDAATAPEAAPSQAGDAGEAADADAGPPDGPVLESADSDAAHAIADAAVDAGPPCTPIARTGNTSCDGTPGGQCAVHTFCAVGAGGNGGCVAVPSPCDCAETFTCTCLMAHSSPCSTVFSPTSTGTSQPTMVAACTTNSDGGTYAIPNPVVGGFYSTRFGVGGAGVICTPNGQL
jgi:hypothetical protein